MSAMRAAELPEVPAALPQHSAPTRVTARGQAASVPLRLTRRGRVVVAAAAALLLAVLSLVIAASAQATNHPAPSGAAQQNLTQVTVRPGQSLWSVAENADPNADTRMVVQQIIELNGLTGTVIFVGQRLWIPRG
jgi:LysM domain